MNIDEYQRQAARTAKAFNHLQTDLCHAALGLATEVGEFTTDVKRAAIYDKPIDDAMRQHMIEELGDIMWYVALAATKLNIPLQLIAATNIAKLAKRYPEAYSDLLAEARLDKSGASARES